MNAFSLRKSVFILSLVSLGQVIAENNDTRPEWEDFCGDKAVISLKRRWSELTKKSKPFAELNKSIQFVIDETATVYDHRIASLDNNYADYMTILNKNINYGKNRFPVQKKACEGFLANLTSFQTINMQRLIDQRRLILNTPTSTIEQKTTFLKISRKQNECKDFTKNYANQLQSVKVSVFGASGAKGAVKPQRESKFTKLENKKILGKNTQVLKWRISKDNVYPKLKTSRVPVTDDEFKLVIAHALKFYTCSTNVVFEEADDDVEEEVHFLFMFGETHFSPQMDRPEGSTIIGTCDLNPDGPNKIIISDQIRTIFADDEIVEMGQNWYRSENGRLITTDPVEKTTVDLRFILAHEIGHALEGSYFSSHTNKPSSYMYSKPTGENLARTKNYFEARLVISSALTCKKNRLDMHDKGQLHVLFPKREGKRIEDKSLTSSSLNKKHDKRERKLIRKLRLERPERLDPTVISEKTTTDNPMTDNSMTDKPMTDNPMTDNPMTDNPMIIALGKLFALFMGVFQ